MTNLLLVALGGALGALVRFGVGAFVARKLGVGWPYGTFLINISGCLTIGLFLPVLADRPGAHEAWRHFLPIGFVGAYTTFSTFEYETLTLLESGKWMFAAGYVLLSNFAGLFVVWLGATIGRRAF
jgi:fluoride exporter